MSGITISLSEEIAKSVRIPPDEVEDEIRKELAASLYARKALSFGKARKLARLSTWQFQQLLAKHKISRHFHDADLSEDIAYAKSDT